VIPWTLKKEADMDKKTGKRISYFLVAIILSLGLTGDTFDTTSAGKIVAWGYNGDGQCKVPSPNSGFIAISAGSYHSLGLKPDTLPIFDGHDFNGDWISDISVWRPSTAVWWIGGIEVVQWGEAGDIPVPGDYDGYRVTDIAIWRPSTGM
jgi:hypothetical protein